MKIGEPQPNPLLVIARAKGEVGQGGGGFAGQIPAAAYALFGNQLQTGCIMQSVTKE